MSSLGVTPEEAHQTLLDAASETVEDVYAVEPAPIYAILFHWKENVFGELHSNQIWAGLDSMQAQDYVLSDYKTYLDAYTKPPYHGVCFEITVCNDGSDEVGVFHRYVVDDEGDLYSQTW